MTRTATVRWVTLLCGSPRWRIAPDGDCLLAFAPYLQVQRTMLELLNQLDGFSSDTRIKVIAATNRPDILDPALLRSGRLDRKIELPLPTEDGRARIMQIHSRKMTVDTSGRIG